MTEGSARLREGEQARVALAVLRRANVEPAPGGVLISSADESAVLPRHAAALIADVRALVADGRDVVVQQVAPEHTERPRCAGCGEPLELADADDPESWIHAFDANDRAEHTAWIGE